MSDARRGGWTWGRLENGVLTDVPAVLPAEQARASVAECMGKGVPVFSTETAEHLAAREMSGIVPVYPSAEALGAAWLSLAEARREELLESPAEPAVCEGSAHHPRQTSRMGREGVIKV